MSYLLHYFCTAIILLFVACAAIFASRKQILRLIRPDRQMCIEHISESEEALRQSEEKFRSVVESSPTAMHFYQLTPDGRLILTGTNPSADRTTGILHQPLTGKTMEEAFPNLTETEVPAMYRRVATGEAGPQSFQMQYTDDRFSGYYDVHVFRTGESAIAVNFIDVTERKRAEDALRESEYKFSSLFASMSEGVCLHEMIYDESGQAVDYRILDVNPSYESIVGIDRDLAVGKMASEFYGSGQPPYLEIYATVTATGEPTTFETYFPPMEKYFCISVFSPGPDKFATAFTDITERKRTESHIRLNSAALDAADDLIAILDREGQVVFANQAFQRQTGYSPDEMLGQDLSLLWLEAQEGHSLQDVWAAIRAGTAWTGEMICRTREGACYTADVSLTPLAYEDDGVNHLIAIARNVTERKVYEGLLDHQAHHDALTQLPNRLLFSKNLETTLAMCDEKAVGCAVFFIDVDRFKLVNDTMGHQAGDDLLVGVAARLGSCLRDGDILARMGGDEFTVLLRNLRSSSDARTVANRMLERVSQPFDIGGSRLVISASVGISLYPENATDVEGLMKSADSAMYKAKQLGRNNCQFYSEELSHANLARVRTEHDLRQAIQNDELGIYFQPIVEVGTMRLSGAEALLRWDHPERGMISPALFVPVAEETGMILEIGRKVLETACRASKRWQDLGFGTLEVSVNASPIQLRSRDFASEVMDILEKTGVSPSCLNLEITETVLAKNDYGELDTIAKLKELGVKPILDDFGIGYSTLSRLKDFPIDQMKVDGSFIRDIEHSMKDRAMTESIIMLAHNLGIQVTAEWIENEEQMSTIRALGCDYAQGYLVSPALQQDAFEDFVREWNIRGAMQRAA